MIRLSPSPHKETSRIGRCLSFKFGNYYYKLQLLNIGINILYSITY